MLLSQCVHPVNRKERFRMDSSCKFPVIQYKCTHNGKYTHQQEEESTHGFILEKAKASDETSISYNDVPKKKKHLTKVFIGFSPYSSFRKYCARANREQTLVVHCIEFMVCVKLP